jgi:DNA-directed RNA polymerase subunit RPC12/RpoP
MRKADLLAMKKLGVTQKMREMVQKDIGILKTYEWTKKKYRQHDYYRYYRATVENEILKVAIFSRKHIVEGMEGPDFEVYIDKKNEDWKTYEPDTGKWYTAKIDNLSYEREDGGWETSYRGYETGVVRKIVNEYFDTKQNKSARTAVLDFQNDVRCETLRRKHKSEVEQIDEVMNEVPKLPKDFDKWVQDKGFYQERYLLYKRTGSKTKAYCTHCNAWVETEEKLVHNAEATCSNCGSKVITKAYGKQKVIVDRKTITIVQRLNDRSGYILRAFDVRIIYKKENGYQREIKSFEEKRYRLDDYFTKRGSYEWSEYRYTGKVRWCYERYHMYGYYEYYGSSDYGVLYTKNLTQLLKGTELKYIPIQKLMKCKEGIAVHAIDVLGELRMHVEYEMLIKMGLIKLVWNLLQNDSEIKRNREEKSPWKYLDITKENMKLAIKMNVSDRELKVMQIAEETNIRLTEEQIRYFARFSPHNYKRIFRLGHIEKFIRYFQEELGVVQESNKGIQDYIDYLNDCEKLGFEMTKQQLFPKNFQNVHYEVAKLRQEKDDRLKKMEVGKKNKLLKEIVKDLRELYNQEDDQFKLILPKCKADFTKEGQQQHNCVGGAYFDRMVKGNCVVAFLRKKEDLKKSFCTVEFGMSGNVIQNRTYCNKEAPKEAQEFINKVSKRAVEILKQREEDKIVQARIQIAM